MEVLHRRHTAKRKRKEKKKSTAQHVEAKTNQQLKDGHVTIETDCKSKNETPNRFILTEHETNQLIVTPGNECVFGNQHRRNLGGGGGGKWAPVTFST